MEMEMAGEGDPPPPDGAKRVGAAIAAYAAVARGPQFAEAGGGVQEISAPIPVYALGEPRADSRPDNVLDRTARYAWRYLVLNGGGTDVADLRDEGHPVLDEAPGLADRIAKAGAVAEEAVSHDPGYEVRLLDLPLIGHSFIWAANADPDKPDRLFSLDDKPVELNLDRTLSQVSEAERQKATAYTVKSDEAGG